MVTMKLDVTSDIRRSAWPPGLRRWPDKARISGWSGVAERPVGKAGTSGSGEAGHRDWLTVG
jgi:hypothetical protein